MNHHVVDYRNAYELMWVSSIAAALSLFLLKIAESCSINALRKQKEEQLGSKWGHNDNTLNTLNQ